jgi:hypothetical protein
MKPPAKLSDTGLFTDIPNDVVAPYALAYTPANELWADGATKRRWAHIPKCSPIDTTDMDHWSFPVGTRVWKEFTAKDASDKPIRVETRLIHRYGPGPTDFFYATYLWNDAQTDADWVSGNDAIFDVKGTDHDIPSHAQCLVCHNQMPDKILGLGAFQLSHDGPGVTIKTLSDGGKLTTPNAAGFTIPGDAVAQAALGYMHANCGHCHNDSGDNPLYLRLRVSDAKVEDTWTFTTAVNVPCIVQDAGHTLTARIQPGSPDKSAIHYEMGVRSMTNNMTMLGQMPPVASEHVDDAGRALVDAWITAL